MRLVTQTAIRVLVVTAILIVVADAVPQIRPVGLAAPIPNQAKEYAVKLAFLYKFSLYVENARPPVRNEMRIGVLGQNPFGNGLSKVARRESQGRKCVPVLLESADHYTDTDILFIPRTLPRAELSAVLAKTAGRSVLLVSERPAFLEQGGVMNFVIGTDGKIKIHLNAAEARRRKLKIDARLLNICIKVNE